MYHLQRDGRLTNIELAKRIGLSPTPTLRRVRALEADGAIEGYKAWVNPEKIGRSFRVMLWLSLERVTHDTMEELEEAIIEIPDIVEAHRMFGDPDYFLLVAVADAHAYESLYTTRLAELPHVQRITSTISMKTIKEGMTLPVSDAR